MKIFTKLLLAVMLAMLLIVVACDKNSSDPNNLIDIDGIIENAAGEPIIEALIEAFDLDDELIISDLTDDEGYFKLEKLPETLEDIELVVSKAGYQTFRASASEYNNVKNGSVFSILLEEANNEEDSCCEGKLYLTIKDKDSEEKVTNGKVYLYLNDSKIRKAEISDGLVVFEELCEGDYWITISVEGYEEYGFRYEQSCNVENEKEVMISKKSGEDDCCGVITICAYDRYEAGVNDVEIKLVKGNTIIEKKYTEGEDPCVEFTDLCAGNYWYRIYHADYDVIEKEIVLGECDTIQVRQILSLKSTESDTCCTASMKVKVKDAESYQYLAQMAVVVTQGNTIVSDGRTNGDGYIIFDSLCAPGTYTFAVYESERYKANSFTYTFEKCKDMQETLMLTPKESENDSCCTASMKVKVKDAEAYEYISGIGVIVYQGDRPILDGTTNGDGYIVFEELCAPGTYTFAVKETEKYKANSFTVTFKECKDLQETLWLTPKKSSGDDCNTIVICAYDDDEQAINDVQIKLGQGNTIIEKKYTSRENPCVTFSGLEDGDYWYRIYHSDYKVIEGEIGVDDCDTAYVNKILESNEVEKDTCCKGILYVFPKDEETKQPIFNSGKVILWKDGKKLEEASLREGRAAFDGLCEGKYGVDIFIEGYKDKEFTYTHTCNETIEQVQYLTKE